ncbi:unnamed protein product, partial [Amoebophrya sp. A25]|eukprot:GSA25T00022013001.1
MSLASLRGATSQSECQSELEESCVVTELDEQELEGLPKLKTSNLRTQRSSRQRPTIAALQSLPPMLFAGNEGPSTTRTEAEELAGPSEMPKESPKYMQAEAAKKSSYMGGFFGLFGMGGAAAEQDEQNKSSGEGKPTSNAAQNKSGESITTASLTGAVGSSELVGDGEKRNYMSGLEEVAQKHDGGKGTTTSTKQNTTNVVASENYATSTGDAVPGDVVPVFTGNPEHWTPSSSGREAAESLLATERRLSANPITEGGASSRLIDRGVDVSGTEVPSVAVPDHPTGTSRIIQPDQIVRASAVLQDNIRGSTSSNVDKNMRDLTEEAFLTKEQIESAIAHEGEEENKQKAKQGMADLAKSMKEMLSLVKRVTVPEAPIVSVLADDDVDLPNRLSVGTASVEDAEGKQARALLISKAG